MPYKDKQLDAACKHRCYERNKALYKRRAKEKKKRTTSENRAFILQYLRDHGCTDCPEKDPIVLVFDHVRGRKRKAVGDMASNGSSLKLIKAEIAKCEVRCCNCHARRTAKAQRHWMLAILG